MIHTHTHTQILLRRTVSFKGWLSSRNSAGLIFSGCNVTCHTGFSFKQDDHTKGWNANYLATYKIKVYIYIFNVFEGSLVCSPKLYLFVKKKNRNRNMLILYLMIYFIVIVYCIILIDYMNSKLIIQFWMILTKLKFM